MAIEKVKAYFRQFGIEDRIREFPVSSATVELAAAALDCAPARIAKTLSFMVNGQPILIVAAGDGKIDNPKYKAQFGTQAKLLTPEEAETLVGHAIQTVFPACGSSNSAIELTIDELERYSGFASWIDVCKGWRDAEAV